jgi:hypothetical protein
MNVRVPEYPCNAFRVGRYLCEMSYANGELIAEWSPRVPPKLSKKMLRQYCAGRDALLMQIAVQIGRGSVLVVEF